jgi:hypothetical protein
MASRAGQFALRHYKGISAGIIGAGILGGTARDDRGFFRSAGGALWGGMKGGAVGGLLGYGTGAALHRFGRAGRFGALAPMVGLMAGSIGLGTFGAFRGGVGANQPVNRIRGLHH